VITFYAHAPRCQNVLWRFPVQQPPSEKRQLGVDALLNYLTFLPLLDAGTAPEKHELVLGVAVHFRKQGDGGRIIIEGDKEPSRPLDVHPSAEFWVVGVAWVDDETLDPRDELLPNILPCGALLVIDGKERGLEKFR